MLLITLQAFRDGLRESLWRNLPMGNGRHHKSAGSLPICPRPPVVGNVPWFTKLWSEQTGSRVSGVEQTKECGWSLHKGPVPGQVSSLVYSKELLHCLPRDWG